MRIFIFTIALLAWVTTVSAQKENKNIAQGNKAYRLGQYGKAASAYQQALKQNPKSEIARYNLANALLREKNGEAAEKAYEKVAKSTGSSSLQSKAWYNNGVTQAKSNHLKEAIESFKKSLRLAPEDNDARENLQKALNQLKQNQNKNKPQQNPKNNKQNQPNKPGQQPQSPKENPDKQRMDKLLDQMRDQEKDLQKKLQKQQRQPVRQPEKDW